MTVVYPVIFTPLEEGGYLAYVPDLQINSHGSDLANAIYMAPRCHRFRCSCNRR